MTLLKGLDAPETRNLSAGHLVVTPGAGRLWLVLWFPSGRAGPLKGTCLCEQLASGWKESYSTYIKNGSPLRGEGPQSDDLH